MLDAQASAAATAATGLITRRLNVADISAILGLQEQVIGALAPAEQHFLKRRTEDYLTRLLTHGIGIGTFDPAQGNRLVAQALLRRQSFEQCETNCNVNNFLKSAQHTAPEVARWLLPELERLGWGVIGTMLVTPEPAYQRKGLARDVIDAMMGEYRQQGGKHLFASTAVDNAASRKVFASRDFALLAEAVDPKDGWRCVIFHHPPHQGII